MCDFPFLGVPVNEFILGDSHGDSENDLKTNVFLAAVASAVDVDVDTDADVRFKDPALVSH